jgi:hypothetical protein
MTDKSLILKTFNKQFFDFLNDILSIVPKDAANEITVSITYFETLKKANPTLLLKIWHHFICIPYADVISKGDISFFLEKDYSADLTFLANSKEVLSFIDSSLRDPIRNMNAVNKEHCMKYMQIICKLADAYMNAIK